MRDSGYPLRSELCDHNSPLHKSNDFLRTQAILLEYFTEELAPWFDACDPFQHFATVIPSRSAQSSTLRHAICAVSARQLLRLNDRRNAGTIIWQGQELPCITPRAAEDFHNNCIQGLYRDNDDRSKVLADDSLAALVILRVFEGLESAFLVTISRAPIHQRSQIPQPFTSNSSQRPFIFASSSTSPMLKTPTTSRVLDEGEPGIPNLLPLFGSNSPCYHDFKAACFWTVLRQEIHMALMQQRQLGLPLTFRQVYTSAALCGDAAWAHQAIMFCANTVDYCYGSRHQPLKGRSGDTWEQLKRQEEYLRMSTPPPYEIQPLQGHKFPQARYLVPWHATGVAYLELAGIILHSSGPDYIRLRPGWPSCWRKLSPLLRQATMTLCGIALSNRHVPALLLIACCAIFLCGEYFDDPNDREALLEILSMIENDLAYSTASIATGLENAWQENADCGDTDWR